jgi:hypothetical protein
MGSVRALACLVHKEILFAPPKPPQLPRVEIYWAASLRPPPPPPRGQLALLLRKVGMCCWPHKSNTRFLYSVQMENQVGSGPAI